MANAHDYRTHAQMIATDLQGVGFDAQELGSGYAVVSLNRKIGLSEVTDALDELGYEPSQYRACRCGNVVHVEPVLGRVEP